MVYEVKNIYDVGFGKTSKRTDMQSFTVNGPLFDIDKKPVGGYIDGENTKKEFIDPTTKPGNFSVDNGIFGVGSDGKPHLISYEEYKKNPIKFKRAFQNGPMLMYNGKDMRETGTSETKYNRSGIGFTPGGDMIVIYSENPVTFKEFTKLFKIRGCTNAIYLDGGNIAAGYEDENGKHGYLDPNATKLQFFHQDK